MDLGLTQQFKTMLLVLCFLLSIIVVFYDQAGKNPGIHAHTRLCLLRTLSLARNERNRHLHAEIPILRNDVTSGCDGQCIFVLHANVLRTGYTVFSRNPAPSLTMAPHFFLEIFTYKSCGLRRLQFAIPTTFDTNHALLHTF